MALSQPPSCVFVPLFGLLLWLRVETTVLGAGQGWQRHRDTPGLPQQDPRDREVWWEGAVLPRSPC